MGYIIITMNNNITKKYYYIGIVLIVMFALYFLISLFDKKIDQNVVIEQLNKNDINLIDVNDKEAMKSKRKWDIVLHDNSCVNDIIKNGTIGLGESFISKKWDVEAIDVLFDKILYNKLNEKFKFNSISDYIKLIGIYLGAGQSRESAYEVEKIHYDIGNNIYINMLGESMAYSCGYFSNTTDLTRAQYNKFELICRKLHLKENEHVLDIGSGFGTLAKYIAENYKCKVTGINISKEQLKYSREICKSLIQNGQVNFIDCDYRDIPMNNGKQYDKIVSVGFFEHVGYRNYKTLFSVAHKLLKRDGLFLLHTISSNVSNKHGDKFINKYIFPNSMLPSIAQIGQSIENLFVLEDLHNFGPDYDKTLLCWHNNFVNAVKSGKITCTESFYRMWIYYLLQCAGLFRSRSIQLWQIVLSKGNKEIYITTR